LYVDRFCRNNIEGSKFAFTHQLRYNLASIVALHRQGQIGKERAAKLATALRDLIRDGIDALPLDPGLEDIQPNLERLLIERLGLHDGGDLSLGRARFEFAYIGMYLAIREELLDTLEALLDAGGALLDLADRHRETLASYYTHHIRAEPITIGYYFSSMAEALLAGAERFQGSYTRLGVSPAGIGQVVPTASPLDRTSLAKLLGMEKTVHHSLYGYWNVDALLDVFGTAALSAGTLGRFAIDLYWWSSSDLGLMTWGEEWTGGSFIMPQKRSPSWLKPVRQAAIDVTTLHAKALNEYLHTAPMLLVGLIEVPGLVHVGLDSLRYGLSVLTKALPTAKIDAAQGRKHAGADLIQSAQLVNYLISTRQASWREAELIVGTFVREALAGGKPLQAPRLIEIAREAGVEVSINQEQLDKCFDPDALIKTRGDSGPAPDAVSAAIAAQRATISRHKAWTKSERTRIQKIWSDLEAAAVALN
ncbi:MAG: lyase family protein, partial [Vulcanimicrobiaceae bacterium]